MVSSGSLLSCDAMFFSVGSQFFGENAFFFGVGIFYIYFFTNLCVYSITQKLFKVFGWIFIGMQIQMRRHVAHKWHNSSLFTFLVISLCIFFFHNFLCMLYNSKTIQDIWMIPCRNVYLHEQTHCTQNG